MLPIIRYIDKAALPVRWKLSGQHFEFIEIELLQIALATSQLTRIMTFYNTINELPLQSEYHNTMIMMKAQIILDL